MSVYDWEPVARTFDPLKAGSIDGTDTTPHDHGVVRAMKAEYKPNKLVTGDPKATIFVGRLNQKTTESTLKEVFSHFGDIKKLRLIRDIVTGFSRGYAFIEYYNKYDANKAQREMNKTILDNMEILVDWECERLLPGWIPRRLGGGFGGKKESGQLRFGGKDRPFKKPIIPFKGGEYDKQIRRDDYNRHSKRDDYDRHSKRDDYDRHRKRDDYDRHSKRDDYDRHSKRDNYERCSKRDDYDRYSKGDDYDSHSKIDDNDRNSKSDDYDRQESYSDYSISKERHSSKPE